MRRVVSMSNSNEMKAGKLTGLKDDNTYIVQISASNEHGRGPMSIKEAKLPGKGISVFKSTLLIRVFIFILEWAIP